MIIIIIFCIIIFFLYNLSIKNDNFHNVNNILKFNDKSTTEFKNKLNKSINYNLDESCDKLKTSFMINNSIFKSNNKDIINDNLFIENKYNSIKIPIYEKKITNNLYKYTLLNNIYIREKINKNDIIYFKYLGGYYKIV